MTAQLSRERLEKKLLEHIKHGGDSEEETMIRMLLARLDNKPVAWIVHARQGDMLTSDGNFVANAEGISSIRSTPLYAAPPAPVAVPDRERVRGDHAKWSQETFGNAGPIGPLKHLSKEALEAAADPGDLSEWADMQFLLWDAQRRAGITDEQITAALEEKLKVNMARQWPEPKDGEPRLHIKAAPEQQNAQQNIPENILGGWIKCSERMPEEGGRYWCYVEELNSLGKSHYQWNCSWNGDEWSDKALTGRVTHWMPLPAAPEQEV